jgi:hypothetical protein
MFDILFIALLWAGFCALPSVLILYYRDTIPPGPMAVALVCTLTLPLLGWPVTLYVALKDWE